MYCCNFRKQKIIYISDESAHSILPNLIHIGAHLNGHFSSHHHRQTLSQHLTEYSKNRKVAFTSCEEHPVSNGAPDNDNDHEDNGPLTSTPFRQIKGPCGQAYKPQLPLYPSLVMTLFLLAVARLRLLALALLAFALSANAREESLCTSAFNNIFPVRSLSLPASYVFCIILRTSRNAPDPTIRHRLFRRQFFHQLQHLRCECGPSVQITEITKS